MSKIRRSQRQTKTKFTRQAWSERTGAFFGAHNRISLYTMTKRPKLGRRRATARDFHTHILDAARPILSVEPPSPDTKETFKLTFSISKKEIQSLSISDLEKRYEASEIPTDVACMMFNFKYPVTWKGVRLKEVLDDLVDSNDYQFGTFYSWDTNETSEEERYFETLPKKYIMNPRTHLVWTMDGSDLPKEHGGPLRLVTPFLQGYKSVKWLAWIDLTAEDEVGYKKKHGFIEYPEFEPPPGYET